MTYNPHNNITCAEAEWVQNKLYRCNHKRQCMQQITLGTRVKYCNYELTRQEPDRKAVDDHHHEINWMPYDTLDDLARGDEIR